ncbi:hypothetical protein SCUCBS95973_009044 [Sporothrix curviconia]|uniref:Tetratricopeptide SHNi-TPR domain-containing protein n=1 Tax=Sporothrix curviconia TaxID=1260050 RepID=A0ABP0CRJ1_9PEZI
MADTPTDTPADVASAVPPVVIASAVPANIRSGVSTPAGSGAVTPAMSELPPDQVAYSLKVSLADQCAKAAMLYSQQKNYEEAAEVYARAAEMQAEINGEMDPENAEILFLYGRSLFKVGQSKSDVLGGKAPETGSGETAKKDNKEKKEKAAAEAGGSGLIAKAISSSAGASAEGPSSETVEAKKPLFQFAGDEEWDASDDEEGEDAEGGEGEGEGDEEEEDDLAVAFEVLDLARVLFEKQLNEKKDQEAETGAEADAKATETADKGKQVANDEAGEAEEPASPIATGVPGAMRHVLERLADTHDLLAEISLENERYPNAIVDSRASLAYKKQYLSEDSEIIAEAHFKLSLALEFASVTTSQDENGAAGSNGGGAEGQQVDQALRDEAATELEAAIASTKLKLQTKEVELATLHSPEDNDATRRQIAEVKDIISDMEQRLVDLRKPPIDLNAAVNGPAGAGLGGLLGALSGGAAGSFGGGVQEAKKAATDLSGLVRKKAKDVPAPAEETSATNGNNTKRKAEEPADGSDDEAKKARTVEA